MAILPEQPHEDGSASTERQRYRLLTEQPREVLIETDLNGRVVWVSPSLVDLLGWAPDAVHGVLARDLVHVRDQQRFEEIEADVIGEAGPQEEFRCMMHTGSGGYRAVTLSAKPLMAAAHEVGGIFLQITDTHDRDAALRALAILSHANRALVGAADENELLQQMCDTIVEVGRYALSWYGRPVNDTEQSVQVVVRAGDQLGYLDEVRVSWGDNPLGRGPTGRVLRLGVTQVENRVSPDPDYRPWGEAADRRGLLSSIALPVVVDGLVDGALMVYADEVGAFDAMAQGLLEDLASDLGFGIARLRARDRLADTTRRESVHLDRLQATIESQIDGFVIMEGLRDEAGQLIDLRYVEANAAALEYNEISREDLIGARLLDLYPGELEHGPLRDYFATIETGESLSLDDFPYFNEVKGEERRYDIRAVKVGDGIALTWRDVTDRYRAAHRLFESERLYRLLAENASDVVILSDRDLRLLWVSASASQALGWNPAELVGHFGVEFIHPEDLGGLRESERAGADEAGTTRARYRWRCADGEYRWFDAAERMIGDDDSGAQTRVIALRDIGQQVRAEQELENQVLQYRLLAENVSDVVWREDPDGRLSWTSPSVTRVLGWRPEELVGRAKVDLIHPADRQREMRGRDDVKAGRSVEGEFRVLRPDGSSRWMSIVKHPVFTPAGLTTVLALRDIEDEVSARQRLEFALDHDELTGLTTRAGLLRRIDYFEAQLRGTRLMAVLCLGVDGLSRVNEALTHVGGDIVLTTVAARVAEAVGNPDLVGRGSGDEFLVLQPAVADAAEALRVAERLREAVRGPVQIDGSPVMVSVSIGIATTAGPDGEQVLREATLALRQAKAKGRDRCEFADPNLAREAQDRLVLDGAIREGLSAGEFVPWFMPIVDLESGDTVGYEALMRWVRDEGVVDPGEFLPVAERSTLVTELDVTILQQAVAVLAQLPEPVFMAVNVTAATLVRLPYADLVLDALDHSGVDPSRLHLELTETMLLSLVAEVPSTMRRLAERGIPWYVDDFGTGYSSIAHLRDLPVSGLKLDLSFAQGVRAGDSRSLRLAAALSGLARGLELDTVAEGVESEVEAERLRALGWKHGQGWLYGKAAPLTPGRGVLVGASTPGG